MSSTSSVAAASGAPEPTTAELLGDFRRELLTQQVPYEIVNDLVLHAGATLINDGLVVRAADEVGGRR
ncbi:hypothetical protein I0C86_41435 [Plantactinospora sp. S1510]|uniref:Uncharacterized protein n=1 Tax=Plantactinospora alkalitolerans TaxID=2789879 RepID=A0ABS0HAJ7_9ACTN|nr:hypothetical protein [Plantactinospora alkalitolerans]MBF9135316.1 hypothetical protein [Plantactinospora alkalitolerans]